MAIPKSTQLILYFILFSYKASPFIQFTLCLLGWLVGLGDQHPDKAFVHSRGNPLSGHDTTQGLCFVCDI